MHIGIDASRVTLAQRTGTEHYTFELLAALAQLDRQNRYTLYAVLQSAAGCVAAAWPKLQPAPHAVSAAVDPRAAIG
jgi:hypothetical protein